MSRLFEALSDEEIKRGLLKIVPRAVALPSAVQPKVTPGGAVRVESPQTAEAAQSLAASVPATVIAPAPVSPAVVNRDVAPSASAELEQEKENSPLREPPLKFVSPDVSPSGTAAAESVPGGSTQAAEYSGEVPAMQIDILQASSVQAKVSVDSRLVAFADPNSLGAEKFRALVTRLQNLRRQREMKSIQITSSVINEGKTLVAGNLAVTLAKYSGAKTLLVEGDLHRPTLGALFGLGTLPGLSHWWTGNEQGPSQLVYKLDGMPLWILPAGKPWDRPSEILSSTRFAKAYGQLARQFDWIVVDSTPMLPIVDTNLWSRLVDGTLLVVREGMAPVKALKKGLQALDSPKLIGVVFNEVSGHDHVGYHDQYYSVSKSATGIGEKTR